jgi:transposase-like protein
LSGTPFGSIWHFTLSYRDVEDLLAEHGLDVSYETVRRWVLKFGPAFARELRRRRSRPTAKWHLDEMAVIIGGRFAEATPLGPLAALLRRRLSGTKR